MSTESTLTQSTRSKFFRVAVEGATTDGRTIDRQTIQQMAETFNPNVYGARIWMEHLRSMVADSPFKAYGDVVAVKAEEVDINGTKKLALYAQIEPTPALIALNKERQKIYTSVEIAPKFAQTGQAYLVGLGITDSPASLGTEVLTFAAQHPQVNLFTSRKQHAGNVFTEAVEVNLELEDHSTTEHSIAGLSHLVKTMIQRFTSNKPNIPVGEDNRFADISSAIHLLLSQVEQNQSELQHAKSRFQQMEIGFKGLSAEFYSLKNQLDNTDSNPHQRPVATGGAGDVLSDF